MRNDRSVLSKANATEPKLNVERKWNVQFVAGLLFFAGLANATGPGWVENVVVEKIANTADGGVNVYVKPRLEGCVSNSGYGQYYASVYPNHPGLKNIKLDLTISLLTRTPISIYFNDSTCRVQETILGGSH